MKFDYYARSETGSTRPTNQDSVFADSVKTSLGVTFLGIVCDGMGGYSYGEIASQTVIKLFSEWYSQEFRYINKGILTDDLFELIKGQWSFLIKKARGLLVEHSAGSEALMGTTLSALMIVGEKYYAAQVGDSRIYRYRSPAALQITTDHSYVAELVGKGLMTADEASLSKEKNVLTRCIGNMEEFSADFYTGSVSFGDCFSISSDGFHGGIIAAEMNEILSEIFSAGGSEMRRRVRSSIARKIDRGEKDNISAICVRVI